jgi:hypothetical protein
VPPSRRWHYGECVPLAATPEWLATLDHHRNLLTFVGLHDEPPSTVWLDDAGVGPLLYPRAIHAGGHDLGLAWNTAVTTLVVSRRADCPAGPD